jgi:hypothetical protein
MLCYCSYRQIESTAVFQYTTAAVQSVNDTESAVFDQHARRALDLLLLYHSNVVLGRSFLGNFIGALHAPAKVVRVPCASTVHIHDKTAIMTCTAECWSTIRVV